MQRRTTTARLLGLTATMALMMGVSAGVASAAPVSPGNTAIPGAALGVTPGGDLVQQVQFGKRGIRGGRGFIGNRSIRSNRYRGYRWAGRRRGPGWVGPAIIGSAIIGGAIAASRSTYGSRWQQCADTYRSFDWDDGTYQPYGGGPRELCPYLRN